MAIEGSTTSLLLNLACNQQRHRGHNHPSRQREQQQRPEPRAHTSILSQKLLLSYLFSISPVSSLVGQYFCLTPLLLLVSDSFSATLDYPRPLLCITLTWNQAHTISAIAQDTAIQSRTAFYLPESKQSTTCV